MKKKKKGFTLVELLVVIAIIALLMGILMPALARVRQIAFRMVCGSNLSGIGRAMLIYANDYEDNFPRAGYQGTEWNRPVLYNAGSRATAYYAAPPGNAGQATISSSFYLLVKYAEVTPKSFVCKGESASTAFKATDWGLEDEEAWDFGPDDTPPAHCSYSYHLPYYVSGTPVFALSTASSEPGMAVAADRNPFLNDSTITSGFAWGDHTKDPITGLKKYQLGNSGPHQREGQNVLFMDNHVTFEKQAYCGVNDDNIYTPDKPGIPREQGDTNVMACGNFGILPNHQTDSLLVNECWGTGVQPPAPPVQPPVIPPLPP
ncbi:MAG TPA: type II secretion system protein [Sedimentisphaerales bacterium]|nr:type II secretion system protein [Sedimentisphaerales bacterium]